MKRPLFLKFYKLKQKKGPIIFKKLMISIAERLARQRSRSSRVNYNEAKLWNKALADSTSDDESSDSESTRTKSRIQPRAQTRKNYNDDYEEEEEEEEESDSDSFSSETTDYEEDFDDEDQSSEYESKTPARRRKKKEPSEEYEEEEDDELIVQSILGKKDPESASDKDEKTEKSEKEEDKYYVKFQDKAYIHCQWLTEDKIEELEGGEAALKRFKNRSKKYYLSSSMSIDNLLLFEDSEINPAWFQIDRIIDDRGDEKKGDVEYRVKWQSLDYNESTWEKKEDIKDKKKIDEYYARLDHSNPTHIPTRWKRPNPDSFKPIEEPPAAANGDTLRDYQLDGLNWLRYCWYNKMNNILADEMGLGKTAQIVSLLSDLSINEGIDGPFLVVAPLSTLPHWRNEFEKWSELNTVIYHGDKETRQLIKNTEFNVFDNKTRKLVPNRVQFDVLVTNYESLYNEFNIFEKIEWRYVIFDEAHKLKNPSGQLYQKVERLAFEHCTMLTGTPIQNNLEELWGLLHLLHPERFDNLEEFSAKYGEVSNSEQVKEIQAIIKPLMLRRKKSDVEKSIAPKEETIVDIELTRVQKKFYRAFLSENANTLLSQITGGALNSLQNLMMQLRKVCNHPYLIKGAEESVLKEKREDPASKDKTEEQLELESMIMASGKLVFIDKLLPKLKEGHHKVLIFSQMVRVLAIIERFLIAKNYKYERLDGSVGENERSASIDRFNNDPEEFVFLLSTKAGGVGINLTAADTVIIYDSDWNPQNDIQAEARCHRIGQTQKVKVYRLITRDTYESKMFERASRKLGLDHVVLDGGDMGKDSKMKASEIEEMLRNGVASIFNDDDTKADEFTSEDIDQILSRRAKVTTSDVISGGDSIFAKASFNADGDDLDINSKDFWSQVLPSARLGDDVPTLRRCRKDKIEKDAANCVSQENDIANAIRSLIANGYTNKEPANMIILRESFRIGNSRYESDKEALKIITKDFPEGDQKEVEKLLGEYGYNIETNSQKVCERVAFFFRLRRALYFAQKDNISWPIVNPPWEDPFHEYALMFGVLKYGMNELTEVVEDESLGLKKAQPLTRQKIEKRVRNLFEGIEKQYKDTINEEIPADFTPLEPKEWQEKHASVLARNTLYDSEILSLIQAITVFGIPVIDDCVDCEKLRNEAKLTLVTTKAVNDVCMEIYDLCQVLDEEREKEKEEEREKNKKLIESEAEKKQPKPMLTRSEAEKEKEKPKESDKDKEPVDLSAYPLLKQINGKLTKRDARKIQTSIDDMQYIYRFIKKLGKRRTEIMKNAPKYTNAPEWWSWECDNALIHNIAQYGLNICSQWVIDPQGPFRAHIPAELLDGFVDAAEKEKLKGKAPRPSELGEFLFLYNQRSRISRATTVIKFISKELRKQKKQKEKDEKEAKKPEKKKGKKNDGTCLLKFKNELKIINFGTIVNTKRFVKKDVVYPVGFISQRHFKIPTSKADKLWYQCEIASKDGKPLFTITTIGAEPEEKFESDDPTTAWRLVAEKRAAETGDKAGTLRGAWLFGLHNKDVKEALSKLPGASTLEFFQDKPKLLKFKIPLKLYKEKSIPKLV